MRVRGRVRVRVRVLVGLLHAVRPDVGQSSNACTSATQALLSSSISPPIEALTVASNERAGESTEAGCKANGHFSPRERGSDSPVCARSSRASPAI
eukprot:12077048-Alexandrium_andersonii.AAC.1